MNEIKSMLNKEEAEALLANEAILGEDQLLYADTHGCATVHGSRIYLGYQERGV